MTWLEERQLDTEDLAGGTVIRVRESSEAAEKRYGFPVTSIECRGRSGKLYQLDVLMDPEGNGAGWLNIISE